MVLVSNRGIVLGYVSPKCQMYTMSDQGRRRIRDLSARRKSLRSPTNNIAVRLRPPRKELGPVRLVDDLEVFEATEGSTDSSLLLYGVETVLCVKLKVGGRSTRTAVGGVRAAVL